MLVRYFSSQRKRTIVSIESTYGKPEHKNQKTQKVSEAAVLGQPASPICWKNSLIVWLCIISITAHSPTCTMLPDVVEPFPPHYKNSSRIKYRTTSVNLIRPYWSTSHRPLADSLKFLSWLSLSTTMLASNNIMGGDENSGAIHYKKTHRRGVPLVCLGGGELNKMY